MGEKFIEVDGKLTVCEKCEKNTYNDVAGLNKECKPCPGNLGTLKTGSKTLDDCVCKYTKDLIFSFFNCFNPLAAQFQL